MGLKKVRDRSFGSLRIFMKFEWSGGDSKYVYIKKKFAGDGIGTISLSFLPASRAIKHPSKVKFLALAFLLWNQLFASFPIHRVWSFADTWGVLKSGIRRFVGGLLTLFRRLLTRFHPIPLAYLASFFPFLLDPGAIIISFWSHENVNICIEVVLGNEKNVKI